MSALELFELIGGADEHYLEHSERRAPRRRTSAPGKSTHGKGATDAAGGFLFLLTAAGVLAAAFPILRDGVFLGPFVLWGAGTALAAEYMRGKYGSELEFLWEDTPDCAICRRSDSKKWYAVFMVVKRGKLKGCAGDPEAEVEIINLRLPPEELPERVDGENFFPAYHMNKKDWVSVRADGVPERLLFRMIDVSYALAPAKRR